MIRRRKTQPFGDDTDRTDHLFSNWNSLSASESCGWSIALLCVATVWVCMKMRSLQLTVIESVWAVCRAGKRLNPFQPPDWSAVCGSVTYVTGDLCWHWFLWWMKGLWFGASVYRSLGLLITASKTSIYIVLLGTPVQRVQPTRPLPSLSLSLRAGHRLKCSDNVVIYKRTLGNLHTQYSCWWSKHFINARPYNAIYTIVFIAENRPGAAL